MTNSTEKENKKKKKEIRSKEPHLAYHIAVGIGIRVRDRVLHYFYFSQIQRKKNCKDINKNQNHHLTERSSYNSNHDRHSQNVFRSVVLIGRLVHDD